MGGVSFPWACGQPHVFLNHVWKYVTVGTNITKISNMLNGRNKWPNNNNNKHVNSGFSCPGVCRGV